MFSVEVKANTACRCRLSFFFEILLVDGGGLISRSTVDSGVSEGGADLKSRPL